MNNHTKEELQSYKEKVLIVMQDTFASALTGMVSPMEFLNMLPLLLSMLHAIFHEGGERTWKCEDDHDHIFESIDRLYETVMEDRAKDNDVISWIDDPAKAAQLEEMQEEKIRKVNSMLDKYKEPDERPSGHLF